jgi:hypothetical protein
MVARFLAFGIVFLLAVAWFVALTMTVISYVKRQPQWKQHLATLALLSMPIILGILVKMLTDHAASLGVEL